MSNYNYSDFISRNYAYIDDALQTKIKKTRLVFAGCGLASLIAEAAARIGFVHFALYDDDKVELSNLNRQSFYLDDVGNYKVIATKKLLLKINPESQVKTFMHKIECEKQIADVLAEGDIIINTIDYGKSYFSLVHNGMQSDKFIICPFNPGFGGMLVCFNSRSGTLFDLLKTDQVEMGINFPAKLRLNNKDQLPQSLIDQFYIVREKIKEKNYYPQTVIGAYFTSAIVIDCLIKFLNDEPVPMAPRIIYKN